MPSLTSPNVFSSLVSSFLLHVFIFSILNYGFSFAQKKDKKMEKKLPILNCDST